jgi:serine/threonine protein kinase
MAMWWDPARIETTVTRPFVCSHLTPEEIERLDRALGFGDGLTDGTYWEWIEEKAKRIFLILVDLGIPGQIFSIVDDSGDDGDLPIPVDQVRRLIRTATKDDRVIRRFHQRQFHYLIKYLELGDHTDYHDVEVVPLDVLDKRPVTGLKQNQWVDRVELPNQPGKVFSRRRIPVGDEPGTLSHDDFLYEIKSTKKLQNDHIVSQFTSYTHQGFGYVLFTPASDYNLKSVLATMPAPLKVLDKQDRRLRLMNWIHCLADTLCYLHNRGRSHGNIKPSTILFNSEHRIFFTDISRLSAETLANSSDKAAFDKESYDYASPEQWYRPTAGGLVYRKSSATSPTSPSCDNYTFSISRAGTEFSNNTASMLHTATPDLNPQAADIFSFGCIILELLSFQMKRQTRSFASHRAAKHKSPGRGGAVLDSSFHKNIGQVESWMSGLAKDASKKDDPVFRGVAPMLQVVARMLSVLPQDRPSAQEVEEKMYKILRDHCQISEPHCVHQYGEEWDVGMSKMKIKQDPDTLSIATTTTRSSGGYRASDVKRSASSATANQRPRSAGFHAIRNLRITKVRT